jgi:cell division protein ZapA (FtsZ GTPase activity inhibitor)
MSSNKILPSTTSLDSNSNPIQTPKTVVMKTLNISSGFFNLIARMAFVETMKIINYFLETVKDEISGFVPSENDKQQVFNNNITLLKTIERISESDEFKKRWELFAENISNLLKILLDKIAETTGNEVNSVVEQLTQLVEKNVKNAVFGAGSGALRGVCALPPVVPFCMMANIASTTSKVGGETIITMLNSASKMADAFSKVFGDTALPLANSIQKARDFFDYIESTRQQLEQGVTNISNKATNIINNNTQKLNKIQNQLETKYTN